jgi:hypothetical protein
MEERCRVNSSDPLNPGRLHRRVGVGFQAQVVAKTFHFEAVVVHVHGQASAANWDAGHLEVADPVRQRGVRDSRPSGTSGSSPSSVRIRSSGEAAAPCLGGARRRVRDRRRKLLARESAEQLRQPASAVLGGFDSATATRWADFRHTGRLSSPTARIASIIAASSSQRNPVTVSSTISGAAPSRDATPGVPQASASIITNPNGFQPADRVQQRSGTGQQLQLVLAPDLSGERDRVVEQRLKLGPGVLALMRLTDLSGDDQPSTELAGRAPGAGGALLPRDPPSGTRSTRRRRRPPGNRSGATPWWMTAVVRRPSAREA